MITDNASHRETETKIISCILRKAPISNLMLKAMFQVKLTYSSIRVVALLPNSHAPLVLGSPLDGGEDEGFPPSLLSCCSSQSVLPLCSSHIRTALLPKSREVDIHVRALSPGDGKDSWTFGSL